MILLKKHIKNFYHKKIKNKMINVAYLCLFDINYHQIIKNLPRETSILEFGSGTGILVDYLLINGFKNITLVELDKNAFQFLSEKYKKINSLSIYNEEAISFLKNTTQKFDLIFTRDFIEHLCKEELLFLFKKIYNILPSKGFMINETPNANNLIYNSLYRYKDYSHCLILNPKSYNEFVYPYFKKNTFKNLIKPHPLILLKYYLLKQEVINNFKKEININEYEEHYNKSTRNITSLQGIFQFWKYIKEYIAFKKSIIFSKKFLPFENILAPHFIAISHKN